MRLWISTGRRQFNGVQRDWQLDNGTSALHPRWMQMKHPVAQNMYYVGAEIQPNVNDDNLHKSTPTSIQKRDASTLTTAVSRTWWFITVPNRGRVWTFLQPQRHVMVRKENNIAFQKLRLFGTNDVDEILSKTKKKSQYNLLRRRNDSTQCDAEHLRFVLLWRSELLWLRHFDREKRMYLLLGGRLQFGNRDKWFRFRPISTSDQWLSAWWELRMTLLRDFRRFVITQSWQRLIYVRFPHSATFFLVSS